MSIESKGIQAGFIPKNLLWQSGQIAIYRSTLSNSLSVSISDPISGLTELDSIHIKCGINGKIPHQDFIRKIAQVARESIAVFVYPSKGNTEEIWVFEASAS